MTADAVAVTPADVTATPRLAWGTPTSRPSLYDQTKRTAMSVDCPIAACGARKWWPCTTSGINGYPFHLRRFEAGMAAEFPDITDRKEQRKLLRRRWEQAM